MKTENFYYSTLKQKPELFNKTIKLIESSLNYKDKNHFEIDFAPLVAIDNHHQCHLIIDQNTENVIGHIGVLKRNLVVSGRPYPVGLIGGVCVAEGYRGKGLFSELMNKIITFHQESISMFMLWTGDHHLYRKFGFHLCIEQVEVKKKLSDTKSYHKTKYSLLSEREKMQIKQLYQKHILEFCASFQRNEKDWKNLELITSTDLFIKKHNEQIVGYFFMNKGQDLDGIIHEIAAEKPYDEIANYGKIWMTPAHHVNADEYETQFASLVRIANIEIFRKMIFHYTQEKILVIEVQGENISFEFNKDIYTIPTQRFLTGLWGPNTFSEFSFQTRPLYVSGLDSI